jgi:hypothetical protein
MSGARSAQAATNCGRILTLVAVPVASTAPTTLSEASSPGICDAKPRIPKDPFPVAMYAESARAVAGTTQTKGDQKRDSQRGQCYK